MKVGVAAGHCWEVAQHLALAATGFVSYVEGVATSKKEAHPAPHGWNEFGGCIVNLIDEFAWQTGERFEEWLYQPVKTYDYTELKAFADKYVLYSHDLASNDLWIAWCNARPNACEEFQAYREPIVHNSD